MTTIAYLEQILKWDSKIRNKLLELERLRDLSQSTSQTAKDIDVRTSGVGRKMENIVVEIVTVENEIASIRRKQKHIIEQINSIDDRILSEALAQRYICDKTYREMELSKDFSHTYKRALLSKARTSFEQKYGAEYL